MIIELCTTIDHIERGIRRKKENIFGWMNTDLQI